MSKIQETLKVLELPLSYFDLCKHVTVGWGIEIMEKTAYFSQKLTYENDRELVRSALTPSF